MENYKIIRFILCILLSILIILSIINNYIYNFKFQRNKLTRDRVTCNM
jgi:hypothetical protein